MEQLRKIGGHSDLKLSEMRDNLVTHIIKLANLDRDGRINANEINM